MRDIQTDRQTNLRARHFRPVFVYRHTLRPLGDDYCHCRARKDKGEEIDGDESVRHKEGTDADDGTDGRLHGTSAARLN